MVSLEEEQPVNGLWQGKQLGAVTSPANHMTRFRRKKKTEVPQMFSHDLSKALDEAR